MKDMVAVKFLCDRCRTNLRFIGSLLTDAILLEDKKSGVWEVDTSGFTCVCFDDEDITDEQADEAHDSWRTEPQAS